MSYDLYEGKYEYPACNIIKNTNSCHLVGYQIIHIFYGNRYLQKKIYPNIIYLMIIDTKLYYANNLLNALNIFNYKYCIQQVIII